ncbi:MAG: hypothetical protein ACLPLR_18225 [Terriglobales bacterium]
MRTKLPDRNWWSGFVAGAGFVYLLLMYCERPVSPALRHVGTLFAIAGMIFGLYTFWTRRT